MAVALLAEERLEPVADAAAEAVEVAAADAAPAVAEQALALLAAVVAGAAGAQAAEGQTPEDAAGHDRAAVATFAVAAAVRWGIVQARAAVVPVLPQPGPEPVLAGLATGGLHEARALPHPIGGGALQVLDPVPCLLLTFVFSKQPRN